MEFDKTLIEGTLIIIEIIIMLGFIYLVPFLMKENNENKTKRRKIKDFCYSIHNRNFYYNVNTNKIQKQNFCYYTHNNN